MARKGGKDRGIVEKPIGSNTWWVRHYVNGREKWHRCENKSQAKVLYGRLKAEIREQTYFPEKFNQRKNLTVKVWIDRCLQGSINRDQQHERQRTLYWSEVFGKRLLSSLTAEDIRRHQAQMQTSCHWAPATINRYLSALRRMLSLAVQDGQIASHPMKGIKFFPEIQTDRFFSDGELATIKALSTPEEWAQTAFAIETCLRAGEQFRARWDHVSLEAKTLTVPLPKGNKTRRVPLSDEACRILRSLASFLESPWVFPHPKNPLQHQNPYQVGKSFKRELRRAGIKGASWHTLRHTGASRRLMAGVDIVTVSKILGHSTIQTTMRYLHLVRSHLSDAVNRGSLAEMQSVDVVRFEPGVKPGVPQVEGIHLAG